MAEVARIDFESIERPFITVNLAGDEKQLPLTFDSEDMELLGGVDDGSEAIQQYFEKYLGPIVRKLGDDQIKQIYGVWIEQREAMGAPELGES